MKKIKIYYDGECHLCSREIIHYQKLDVRKNNELVFSFIDITDPKFLPENDGLNSQNLQKAMHVRDEDEKLHIGVEAFIVIWNNIPRYHFAAKLIQLPVVLQVSKIGYAIFARIRKYLPKRNNACKI